MGTALGGWGSERVAHETPTAILLYCEGRRRRCLAILWEEGGRVCAQEDTLPQLQFNLMLPYTIL